MVPNDATQNAYKTVATIPWRWIAGQAQVEIGEEQNRPEHAFRERHSHKGEDLPEKKFMSGDAGDIDL